MDVFFFFWVGVYIYIYIYLCDGLLEVCFFNDLFLVDFFVVLRVVLVVFSVFLECFLMFLLLCFELYSRFDFVFWKPKGSSLL